ncbi:MAG: BamA/TamA family outer membrane protein, partial [Spirochaetia bacterium]
FSYNTNWLFDQRMSGGVDFSFSRNNHQNVLQDMEYPRFTDDEYGETAAPDPYDSEEEWEEAEESVDDAHRMEYDEYEVSLGINTGYTFHTNLGRIGTSTGLRSGLSYISYDEDLYRPFNPTTRENHERWRFNNQWWSRVTWDTRDYIFSPSSGFHLSETFTYSGGLLGGVTHYLKSETKGEYFHTLFDIPVFSEWNLKTVLALHSSVSVIFPQLFYKDGNWKKDTQASSGQMLYTDGMNTDRGHERRTGGEAMWNNWVELRVPLAEQVLWSDFFFRSTGLWTDRSDFGFYTDKDALIGNDPDSGYTFSYGGGLRFTIPNLPLGLYLTRTFEVDEDDGVVFNGGPLFSSDDPESGWRLVLTINVDLM